MTKDEIVKLEAGVFLDALVGEHVMGLPPGAWALPFYSTDIAAAWQVVMKMRENGYLDYHEYEYGKNNLSWWLFTKDDCDHYVEAKTDALAICQAALLAVLR